METSLNDSEVPSRQLHRPVSFLVVDDEQRARKSLIELLNSNWTDITEAEDGEQAIALIQKRQFNLIILDPKISWLFRFTREPQTHITCFTQFWTPKAATI